MSPVGLDVLEYAFEYYDVTQTDAAEHVVGPDAAGGGWFVTKIQFYAASGAAAGIALEANDGAFDTGSTVVAGGSLCLDPGGAFRKKIKVVGDGSRLIVEYWYRPAPPNGSQPNIVYT